jgi:hypothetical protein
MQQDPALLAIFRHSVSRNVKIGEDDFGFGISIPHRGPQLLDSLGTIALATIPIQIGQRSGQLRFGSLLLRADVGNGSL